MALSPAPSCASSEDLCSSDLCSSDLDDTDSEHNHSSAEQGLDPRREATSTPTGMPSTVLYSQSMWRPW